MGGGTYRGEADNSTSSLKAGGAGLLSKNNLLGPRKAREEVDPTKVNLDRHGGEMKSGA